MAPRLDVGEDGDLLDLLRMRLMVKLSLKILRKEAQFLKCPGEPSAQELEQHRMSHLPYRLWCRWCVMGRGTGTAHSKMTKKSSIPRIGVDYFFIIDGIVKFRHEVELTEDDLEAKRSEGLVLKCVLVRDWDNKAVWAHVIPRKGPDEEGYAAKLIADDIKWMGHAKIALKYDNEGSLRALIKQVVKILHEDSPTPVVEGADWDGQGVMHENPPTYDSQSNGGTEIGVRLVRGLFRTLRLCLEARLGKRYL